MNLEMKRLITIFLLAGFIINSGLSQVNNNTGVRILFQGVVMDAGTFSPIVNSQITINRVFSSVSGNDGTFSFKSELSDSIYVEGEGPSYHWTRKALARIGYSVTQVPADPYIISPSSKNRQWILSTSGKQHCFDKLYDLVRSLSTGERM